MAAWLVVLCLGAPALEDDVRQALDASKIRRAGLSIAVGRAGAPPSFAYAAGTARVPASNQKLLTAAAALRRLGPSFHFVTRVRIGPDGELVVVGDGDPNVSGRFFDGDAAFVLRTLARDVRRQGIEAVTDLVLDASRFDDVSVHPDWPADQLDKWYCAPVAALVFNDSCWDIAVHPGRRPGAIAEVLVEPALLRPGLVNDCVTVGDKGRHVVHIARGDPDGLAVGGRILLTSQGVTSHVTVEDPVRFFGLAFRAALEQEGVRVNGRLRRGRVPDARDVVLLRGDLKRTLEVILRDSQNLYAECLFKRLGRGSFESGAAAVTAALLEMQVRRDGLVVRDGSGLARTNRVSARTLYDTLQALRDEPLFVEALAQGGAGTLRKRYRSLGPRVRAKTGTIRGVSALSGYVTGREGTRYVFAVLANGSSVRRARRLQDLVVLALARRP